MKSRLLNEEDSERERNFLQQCSDMQKGRFASPVTCKKVLGIAGQVNVSIVIDQLEKGLIQTESMESIEDRNNNLTMYVIAAAVLLRRLLLRKG